MANMDLDVSMEPPVDKVEDEEEGDLLMKLGDEFEQFANALDDCFSSHLSASEQRERILDLPQKYYDNAVRRLSKLKPEKLHDDADMDTDDAGPASLSPEEATELSQLEAEVQTWDLLRRVLPLRYPSSETKERLCRLQNLADRPDHNLKLEDFLESDPVAAERRAVLQWLQSNAASGAPDIEELTRELQQNADRGDIIAHGWLHTRSTIKMKKTVTGWPHLLDRQSASISKSHTTSTGAPLVTQLDPDAPSRQDRHLQPQDEYFERAIWLGCFEHLRRGSSLDTIREWCQERTELWRAISMSAMPLSNENDDAPAEIEASHLALWRRMCFSLARQGGSDDYERAVYGVLAGDITSVEKVASTWDDHLFTHYNALLRTQIDAFVLSQCDGGVSSNLTTTFSSFDAIQFHGETEGVELRLVRSLEKQSDALREEVSKPNKALQAAIVAKDVDDYLRKQGASFDIDPEATTLEPRGNPRPDDTEFGKFFKLHETHGLRIVAHIYVLLASLGRIDNEGKGLIVDWKDQKVFSQESLVALYTDLLRRANLTELVPRYCAILEEPRRYRVLSQNLIHIQDNDQRLTQLKLMKRAGIDVVQFVSAQAAMRYNTLLLVNKDFEAKSSFRILQDGEPSARLGRGVKADFFGDDDKSVENGHDEMIRALEWLLMVDQTWHRVLSLGVQIHKYFLKHMHLLAARRLMEKVPFSEIMQGLGLDEIDEDLLDRPEFWGEQLSQKGITNAVPEEVMADARNFRDLEFLVRALDSLETIGSLVEISADVPSSDRAFWSSFGSSIMAVKDSMEPLLKGWMLAGIEAGDKELQQLRTAYLPETVLAYVSALHIAGTSLSRDWLLECMQLASVIAERNSDLERLFVESKRVKELLEAFAACSKALAITTGDKRATGQGSKKLREMGWSRDLWSVKSST